jgi:hypothetical protein
VQEIEVSLGLHTEHKTCPRAESGKKAGRLGSRWVAILADGVQNLYQLLRAAQGDGAGNWVTDGVLATGEHSWLVRPVHGRISRGDAVAFRGTHSLKYEIDHGKFAV